MWVLGIGQSTAGSQRIDWSNVASMANEPGPTELQNTQCVSLLSELVQINSVNPDQAGPKSGPGGEADLAHWLADRCRSLGADVTVDEVAPDRPNMYAYFEGTESRTVLVDVHLDTVGVEHMTDAPFDGRVEQGRLYGRGSVDTKASFAVVLDVLASLSDEGRSLKPNLILAGTVGEEAGGFAGAYRLEEWLGAEGAVPDQMIVAEPTMCAPVYGHKGGLGMAITVHGEAAHSSKPELGRNAIVAAARVIAALDGEHERLISGPAPTEVGNGTLAVTTVNGGLAANIIPDRCDINVNRRIAPGEDTSSMVAELEDLVRRAADPEKVDIALTHDRVFPAFYRDAGTSLVSELTEISQQSGSVAAYGTNAVAYDHLPIDIVVFGPGSIDQAHKAQEWVALSELASAGRIYRQWLTEGGAS